jgi:hypothetical protein
LSEINKSKEQEITFLFNTAKDEMGKINQYANQKKTDIVIILAKDLEGKIQTDKICIEIIKD